MLFRSDECFRDLKIKRHHLLDKGLIDYQIAWTLFPRDSTIYSYGINSEFIAKVDNTEYRRKDGVNELVVNSKVISFNGKRFIWTKKELTIEAFVGNKPSRELRHYPFDMHPDQASIQDHLLARGRKALDLQGLSYCSYSGISLEPGIMGYTKHNVEGRILVDVVGYNTYHLAQGKREDQDPDIEAVHEPQTSVSLSQDVIKSEDKCVKNQQKRISEEDQILNKERLLEKPNDIAFISELISGYALKNKIWSKTIIEIHEFIMLTNDC